MLQKNNLELLLKYPLILNVKHSNTQYHGWVKVNDIEYHLEFQNDMNKYTLKPTEDLKPFWNKIEEITALDYLSTVEFLDRLVICIREYSKLKNEKVDVDLYRKILHEYSELKNFYINVDYTKLHSNLEMIQVVHLDEKNRKHPITIAVNHSNKNELYRIVDCDLPTYLEELVKKPENSLLTLYDNFLKVVNNPSWQILFDVLDGIDQNCWVLEPQKPTRKDVYRRIMLDTDISIMLIFNPEHVKSIPQIKFLGRADLIKKYFNLYNKNCVNYNPNGDIILELYNLLEINNFPRQPENVLEEELLLYNDEECCLCFTMYLNGKVPEIVCENKSCRKHIHSECLQEWFKASGQFYERYGNCPNCDKRIHFSCRN